MRITGGQWRSRRLKGPGKSLPVRPTPDAMRERAFNVIGSAVVEARVLDLFAGTGAVGLEALSRGARRTVFVEQNRRVAHLLAANLQSFALAEPVARLLVCPVDRALTELARRGERFDLVWADPPFERWLEGLEALTQAVQSGLLEAGGRAFLECPDRAARGQLPPSLELLRELAGGASRVWIVGPS